MNSFALAETEFGKIICYANCLEVDIMLETKKGDLLDLFGIYIGDNCLKCRIFANVFDEDCTEEYLINENDINEAYKYE